MSGGSDGVPSGAESVLSVSSNLPPCLGAFLPYISEAVAASRRRLVLECTLQPLSPLNHMAVGHQWPPHMPPLAEMILGISHYIECQTY